LHHIRTGGARPALTRAWWIVGVVFIVISLWLAMR
jgi:preprotein translocase subunit SecG